MSCLGHDTLGDRGHRRAKAGLKVVSEDRPAVLQPGFHISKNRRKIVSLELPDHQVALRLCPGEVSEYLKNRAATKPGSGTARLIGRVG
jgi:hypothetical protein